MSEPERVQSSRRSPAESATSSQLWARVRDLTAWFTVRASGSLTRARITIGVLLTSLVILLLILLVELPIYGLFHPEPLGTLVLGATLSLGLFICRRWGAWRLATGLALILVHLVMLEAILRPGAQLLANTLGIVVVSALAVLMVGGRSGISMGLVMCVQLAAGFGFSETFSAFSPADRVIAALTVFVLWVAAIFVDVGWSDAERVADERRDDAERANLSKGRFLAAVSHEVRTPMNGIMGMARLLQTSALSSEQRRYTDTILRSARGLQTVLDDVLDFSKMEAGHIDLHRTSFDPRGLVEDVADLFAQRAVEADIHLSTVVAAGLPRAVTTDEARLRQVLVNLVSNAVKFAPGCAVCVAADVVDGRLRVSVRDTGPGIETKHIDQIFSPYYRIDARIRGTGLGLAISRGIACALGGDLSLATVAGEGATFSLVLPVSVDEEAQLPPLTVTSLICTADDATFASLCALLRVCGVRGRRVESLPAAPDDASVGGVIFADDGLAATANITANTTVGSAQQNGAEPSAPRVVWLASWNAAPRAFDDMRWLRVPLRLGAVRQRLSGGPTQDVVAASPLPRLPGVRVLVAEDNDVNVFVIEEMLRHFGARATTVRDGAQCVAAVQMQPVDVVLMDIQMPVLDGLAATRQIRALTDPVARLPIIALSGNAMPESREIAREAGMNDYLTKPIDPTLLHETLRKWTQPDRRAVDARARDVGWKSAEVSGRSH